MTQNYIGTKLVTAWESAAEKDYGQYKIGDPGYGVKYQDGYISWSPKEVFEAAYLSIGPDEPTGFIPIELVQNFILGYEIQVITDSVVVAATLANKTTLTQAVGKTSLAKEVDGQQLNWIDQATDTAVSAIITETTKHLAFMLACAQNGINFNIEE